MSAGPKFFKCAENAKVISAPVNPAFFPPPANLKLLSDMASAGSASSGRPKKDREVVIDREAWAEGG